MSDFRKLSAGSRAPRDWRNGGGATNVIAVFPDEADDDNFLWRASIATIAVEGSFSTWPGIDRALVLLRGQITLLIGGRERQLEVGAPAMVFAGEEDVAARPEGGPCSVLNIMTRRGCIEARLERWMTARPSDAQQLLLLAQRSMAVEIDGRSFALDADDAMLFTNANGRELHFYQPLIVAELFELPRRF